MLELLIFFVSILGVSLVPIGEPSYFRRIVQSIALITVTLFIFSVFQILEIGVVTVQATSILFLILGVWNIKSRQNWNELLGRAACLALIFVLAYFASLGKDYWAWDEFSHWGAQVDYLIAMTEIHSDNKILLFPDYIPGLSLWRYYSYLQLDFAGKSSVYFGNYLLIFSLIFSVTSSKGMLRILQVFLVYLCILAFFQSLILTLYVEHIQALLLLCFFVALTSKQSVNIFYLSLLVCMLVLSKHVGLIFAVFAIFSFVCHQVYVKNVEIKVVIKNAFTMTFFSMTLFVIWAAYVGDYSLSRDVVDSDKIILGSFFETLDNMLLSAGGLLNSHFPHANMIKSHYSTEGYVYLWQLVLGVLVYLCAIGVLIKKGCKEKVLYILLSILIIISYVLFLSYIRAGTPWGGDIYSFSRYLCVIIFPIVVLPMLHIKKFQYLSLITVIYLLVTLPISPPIDKQFAYNKGIPSSVHRDFNKKVSLLKAHASSSDSVWYIHSQNTIVSYFVFREKAIPIPVLGFNNGWGLYINKESEGISLSERIEGFEETICKADYIYVDIMPDDFWEDYGSFFDNRKDTNLFVVNKRNDECLVTPVIEG